MKPLAVLAPTLRKLARTAAGFAVFPIALAATCVPPEWDVLDLRSLGRGLIGLLLGVPIRGFDLLTASAFAPRSESFLVLPTLPQVAAALAADAVLFYALACAWERVRETRGHGTAAQGSS